MIVEYLILIFTSLVFYFVYNHYNLVSYFRSKGVKCNFGLPLCGNILQNALQKRHIKYDIQEVYKSFPGERYIGFIESTAPIYILRDPELIKKVTVKDFDHFVDHRALAMNPLLENSLVLMKGDRWRDMRTTLSPAFTGSKIRSMAPLITEICNNFIQYFRETEGQEIDLTDLVHRYTIDVIASVAYGLEVNSLKEPNNDFYKGGQSLLKITVFQKLTMKWYIQMYLPILAKVLGLNTQFPQETIDFYRNIVLKTMKYRETNHVERADMIQILMEAAKGTLKNTLKNDDDSVGFATTEEYRVKDTDKVRKWTEDELVAQAFIFFSAGFKTTSVQLVLALHELAINGEVQQKLYEEVRRHHQENKTLTYEHVPELKYMDCVVNEVLRKWGLPSLDRVCVKPYELPPPHKGGKPVMLKPGDVIYVPVYSLHMDEQYYPEPDRFDPERFNDENKATIKPFTYMPFGSGPRNCIGSRFALLELKVLLYHIILNFEMLKCSKTTDPIHIAADLNVRVVGGTWVKMQGRSQ